DPTSGGVCTNSTGPVYLCRDEHLSCCSDIDNPSCLGSDCSGKKGCIAQNLGLGGPTSSQQAEIAIETQVGPCDYYHENFVAIYHHMKDAHEYDQLHVGDVVTRGQPIASVGAAAWPPKDRVGGSGPGGNVCVKKTLNSVCDGHTDACLCPSTFTPC